MVRGEAPIMFTVDQEGSSTIITTLDSTGENSDIEVILDPSEVIIRQWDEDWQQYNVMFLSHQQLNDIKTAMENK
jgi:hypothetical protein